MKICCKIVPLVLVLIFVLSTNVFAFKDFKTDMTINTTILDENGKATGETSEVGVASNAAKRIWGTASLALQICAVAAVVFAGVRYMFASADGKADIKKQTVGLIVGAVLVFGATTVISFITTLATQITNNT